jgi:hypothetical protein
MAINVSQPNMLIVNVQWVQITIRLLNKPE